MTDSSATILAYVLALLLMLGYAGAITLARGRARRRSTPPSALPAKPLPAVTHELKPREPVKTS